MSKRKQDLGSQVALTGKNIAEVESDGEVRGLIFLAIVADVQFLGL